MNNKYLPYILATLLSLCSFSTYAAGGSNASLWGSIDQPVPPIQQIEQQEAQVQAQQTAIENEQTVCQIIQAQPSLSSDTGNADKIKAGLQQAYKASLPDYKIFLVSQDAANDLFAKWRDLYIKTYCLQSGQGKSK